MVVVPKALNPYTPNIPQNFNKTFKDYLKDIRFLNRIIVFKDAGSSIYQVPEKQTLYLLNVWIVNRTGAGLYQDNVHFNGAFDDAIICYSGILNEKDTTYFNIPFPVPSKAYLECGSANALWGFEGFLMPDSELSSF